MTGAPLSAVQCRPDPSVQRLNDNTVLYLPGDAAASHVLNKEPVDGAILLTACRRLKVWCGCTGDWSVVRPLGMDECSDVAGVCTATAGWLKLNAMHRTTLRCPQVDLLVMLTPVRPVAHGAPGSDAAGVGR